jgi:hypothetical protein
MLTLCAQQADASKNIQTLTTLLASAKSVVTLTIGGNTDKNKKISAKSVIAKVGNDAFVKFLRAYRWEEREYPFPRRPADTTLQLEFLESQKHGIRSWLVVAPQRQDSFGKELVLKGVGALTV